MEIQRTLGIVKSGAVMRRHTMSILSSVGLMTGCYIKTWRYTRLSQMEVRMLYQEHVGKDFFSDLMDSVMGPRGIVTFVIYGPSVIQRWRALIGPTKTIDAMPGTLRCDYGLASPVADNAVHGSADEAAAEWEIALFFPELMQGHPKHEMPLG